MRLHHPLDNILNNEIKIKLLRFLCRTGGEWSGRRLAREIKASPAAVHKALFELHQERILRFKNIGRSYLYSLRQDNLIVKNLLQPLYKKEKDIPLALANIVKKLPLSIKKRVLSLSIFGSVSRKKEKPYSDIDLLVIVKDIKDKQLLEQSLKKINDKIIEKFDNILSPYIITPEEFRLKFKKRLALIKNIIQEHRLIFGKSLTSIIYASKKD